MSSCTHTCLNSLSVCRCAEIKGNLTVCKCVDIGGNLKVTGTTSLKSTTVDGNLQVTNGAVTAPLVVQGVQELVATANSQTGFIADLSTGTTIFDCNGKFGSRLTLKGTNATVRNGQTKRIVVVNATSTNQLDLQVERLEGVAGTVSFVMGEPVGTRQHRSVSFVWSTRVGKWVYDEYVY